MALVTLPTSPHFLDSHLFGSRLHSVNFLRLRCTSVFIKRLVVEARAPTRTESAKTRNLRKMKKLTGSANRPRLSVFCSDKQLYAMVVDDERKKCLFYGSTVQKCIRGDPPCCTVDAARRLGEEVVRACAGLKITEISSLDRNGCRRGERIRAFEIPLSHYGFRMRS